MRLGKIDKVILFGGGPRLCNLLKVIKEEGYPCIVFSSPRFLSAPLQAAPLQAAPLQAAPLQVLPHRATPKQGAGAPATPKQKETLKERLNREKITFLSIPDINTFKIELYLSKGVLGISVGAPWIFRKPFIDKFKGRLINSHSSRLPLNRGGGGYSWRIMRNDREGQHLFHFIDTGIDSGRILFTRPYRFPKSLRTPLDFEKFHEKSEMSFFRDFFIKIKNGHQFKVKTQDETKSTYFPRLSTIHHGFVDWSWPADDIELFINAFDEPYGGASTFLNGNRVIIRGAEKALKDGSFHPFMRGLIYRKNKRAVFVAANNASVVIRTVTDKDGKDIIDSISPGDRFVTPVSFLEEALKTRVFYDPQGARISGTKKITGKPHEQS